MNKTIAAMILAATTLMAAHTASAASVQDGMIALLQGDAQRAYSIWQPLALRGDRDAQYHLGYMYQTGTGVKKDPKQALYWYNLAAKNGHWKAPYEARVVARELARR